jgi:alpha-tubulin suppressor-like RCC1 family protein
VFGWGKCNEGQLGFRPSKGVKMQTIPVIIPFKQAVKEVCCGSLFSMALI